MHVVVAGILVAGSRVLLCHRRPDRRWHPDVWDLPGGHVEPGESEAAALARELAEELGISIAPPGGPPVRRTGTGTAAGDLRLAIWVVRDWSGGVHNACPAEHDALDWFGADQLAGLEFADPSYLSLLTDAVTAPSCPRS